MSPETSDVTQVRRAVDAVLAAAAEAHPARADQTAVQDVVVVGLDLRPAGPFLEPRLRPDLLHLTVAEEGRRDAVELRGLVQLHERIGVVPVTAGGVATVDEGDVDVGVIDQGVGERHAHGAGTDDEVVGLE